MTPNFQYMFRPHQEPLFRKFVALRREGRVKFLHSISFNSVKMICQRDKRFFLSHREKVLGEKVSVRVTKTRYGMTRRCSRLVQVQKFKYFLGYDPEAFRSIREAKRAYKEALKKVKKRRRISTKRRARKD